MIRSTLEFLFAMFLAFLLLVPFALSQPLPLPSRTECIVRCTVMLYAIPECVKPNGRLRARCHKVLLVRQCRHGVSVCTTTTTTTTTATSTTMDYRECQPPNYIGAACTTSSTVSTSTTTSTTTPLDAAALDAVGDILGQ